jgi:hypothetical protein
MTENNGWSGKPGVPLNPEQSGWHWLMCPLKNDVFARFWRAAGETHNYQWNAKWLYGRNEWNSKACTYLGPALTPAEVEARLADALKWRGAINDALTNWLSPIEDHETPADALQRLIRLEVMAALDPAVSRPAADLVAQARREALEEAAQFVETHTYVTTNSALKNKLVPYARAKRGLHHATIAAAIRALKGEGDE